MKKLSCVLICCAVMLVNFTASAQTYLKLNCLYAVVGVISPSLEVTVSPHSTLGVDLTYSPWQSVKGKHAHFGIAQGEYRYYFKQSGSGWYVSGNAGVMAFDLTKPKLFAGKKFISFKEGYARGFGIMLGAGGGYQHIFKERWVVDVFLAIDWSHSWYTAFDAEGKMIDVHMKNGENVPGAWNRSAEWLPGKVGVSLGYRIIDPNRTPRGKRTKGAASAM